MCAMEFVVPQGTILGPLRFKLYLNDLFEFKTEGDITTFANDTAIFYEGKDRLSLKQIVDKDLGIRSCKREFIDN